MSVPPGGGWEPEPLEPGAAPSPYAAPGAAPSAPGYAALYPTAPGATAHPPAPGYAALYPSPSYPPPAAGYPGAMPGYGYQAGPYRQRPNPGPMPPNHLVLAIVALLFVTVCGIVALVYATQVESRWRAGDVAGAHDASEKARRWGWASIIISGVFLALYLLLLAAGMALGS